MMRVSLHDLLFSQAKQEEVILQLAAELEALSPTRPLDWLGNPMPTTRPQRKRAIQQTLADVLGSERRRQFEVLPDINFTDVAAGLRNVVSGGNGLDCTFFCLLALLVCDNLVDVVARSTPRRVCDSYFTAKGGFEARLTAHLTGRMGYNGTSGVVLQSAEPSFCICVKEMQFLKSLISPTGT